MGKEVVKANPGRNNSMAVLNRVRRGAIKKRITSNMDWAITRAVNLTSVDKVIGETPLLAARAFRCPI